MGPDLTKHLPGILGRVLGLFSHGESLISPHLVTLLNTQPGDLALGDIRVIIDGARAQHKHSAEHQEQWKSGECVYQTHRAPEMLLLLLPWLLHLSDNIRRKMFTLIFSPPPPCFPSEIQYDTWELN